MCNKKEYFQDESEEYETDKSIPLPGPDIILVRELIMLH